MHRLARLSFASRALYLGVFRGCNATTYVFEDIFDVIIPIIHDPDEQENPST
jgi:hypothetical protein